MTLLEVSDLRVSFPSEEGRVAAVRGIDYHVDEGEVVGIVGESGSGKSVSSLAVLGLLPDHARITGSIRFDGRELLGMSDRELSALRGKSMSMVFQDPLSALTPVYRVGDQIAEALLVHGAASSRKEAGQRAVELLDLVGIDDAPLRAKAFPHEFSGGMRQRVVIAMAIANDPALIICDEPTTALDVTVQAQILQLLRKARDITGAGVVLITHDLGIAATMADRILVMYAGRIVESAPTNDLFERPQMPYTAGLLGSIPRLDGPPRAPLLPIPGAPPQLHALPPGCSFAPRCPLVVSACTEAEPPLVAHVAAAAVITEFGTKTHRSLSTQLRDHGAAGGGDHGAAHLAACIRVPELTVADRFDAFRVESAEATTAQSGETVLRVENLVKTYPLTTGIVFRRKRGEVRAVDGVSFELRAGRTLALVGESGSGKSTTLTQILDLAVPEAGSIEVFGHDVAMLTRAQRRDIRRRMQIVFQDPTAALDPRLPVFDLLAEPLRVDGRSRAEIAARVPELLDLVGLQRSHADRYPADFSGGQKQRINIARALALDPELLVLDEPVSSLDVSIQAGVLNLLRKLQAERKMAYLFVSHDLSVVRNLAHDVAVMYRGKLVEYGTAEQVFGEPGHDYTRELLAAVPG
ncbi:MAG: ABC transporter ATP-binding protein [Aldersonia sp.]|nr:ABC transporter ATP-binding protein [Aldersonia sp.]